MPDTHTPDPVCGACVSYEPSRNDPHYGYCKRAAELDRARSVSAGARMVDVNHRCFLRHADWQGGAPAFAAKGGAA